MTCRRSFTLVEVMIAVAIISILLTLALPAVMRVFTSAKVSRFVNDLRVVSEAFQFYSFDNGSFPPESSSGVVPDGMDFYLREFPWSLASCIGGNWDWDNDGDKKIGVAVKNSTVTAALFTAIDEKMDDGDLGTGQFTAQGSNCMYRML